MDNIPNGALEAYSLYIEWVVDVQTYSGAIANVATYAAILNSHDKTMTLSFEDSGHTTVGYKPFVATKLYSFCLNTLD